MPPNEPHSLGADEPTARPPHQQIADLLAQAILRRRAQATATTDDVSDPVGLGFPATERVNANPPSTAGVRA